MAAYLGLGRLTYGPRRPPKQLVAASIPATRASYRRRSPTGYAAGPVIITKPRGNRSWKWIIGKAAARRPGNQTRDRKLAFHNGWPAEVVKTRSESPEPTDASCARAASA
jgi:hypothetical protein